VDIAASHGNGVQTAERNAKFGSESLLLKKNLN